MARTKSRNLRGDALAARAVELGIALEDYRDENGAINELDLRRRISMVERYSSEFRIGQLLAACIVAFVICGVAAWLAIHFLWHPYY